MQMEDGDNDDSPASSPESSPRSSPRSPRKIRARKLSEKEVDEINAINTEERRLSRRRSQTNLRNYNTFHQDFAHLRQETGLEQELGTRVQPVDLSPSPRWDENPLEEQKRVIARRGLQRRPTQVYVKFDNFAETLFISNFEAPWFLSSCVDHPMYQRMCNPAEFATQRRRDELETAALSASAAVGGEKVFGLPPFAKAGFHILSQEDARLPDLRVSQRLGLQLAVHRKTSMERLCLKVEKARLPPYVKEEQIQSLVKALKKCDHVNVLNCKEVCEDDQYLYFLHENFPCVTLLSQLENVKRMCSTCTEKEIFEKQEIAEKVCSTCGQKILEEHIWSHEQIVNIARECYAATAYCNELNLYHLGWTLCHVLLPVTSLYGDPMVSKIFGFGHMGVLHTESHDRTCWSPEMVAEFHRLGESFVSKMEGPMKTASDCWSLGVITYTLVAKRPPMVGKGKVIDEQILSRRYVFNPIFDEVDIEAKALVESFMQGIPEKRMRPEAAIRNEWIRRRWKPPKDHFDVFAKLEDFCRVPLSKRLFGRFLVGFLDAEHMRRIAIEFYALDAQGDGVISLQDLRTCAKSCERPVNSAKLICSWLCPGAENISLSRFAECMAEDIIDGRALRHAFEMLDENGSEEITPEELFSALSALDDDITMEQVMAHINEAETLARERCSEVVGDVTQKGHDHKIDFDEFQGLFPVRVERLMALQGRSRLTRDCAKTLTEQYQRIEKRAKGWIREIEDERKQMKDLDARFTTRKEPKEAAKELTAALKRINRLLRLPPGPASLNAFTKACEAASAGSVAKKKKRRGGLAQDGLLHFDSFLQDFMILNLSNTSLHAETRNLKLAVVESKRDDSIHVDCRKAADVCENTMMKLDMVLQFARGQMEEKQLILQTMSDLEPHMPPVTPTARGLMPRQNEDEDDDDQDGDGNDDGNLCAKLFSKFNCSADPQSGSSS